MKLTIVTISFNQAPFLEQAILSVLDQRAALSRLGWALDYIIVDPGSTDGSRDIIERHRSSLSQVIYEPDAGPADGLNRGFSGAEGEWFGYLNSDDFYLPGALVKAVEAMGRNPLAGAVVGNGWLVDASGRRVRMSLSQRHTLRRAAYGAAFALQQATFYRADAFRQVGGFNLANGTCWDGEILLDLAQAGWPIARFQADVGAFRLHGGSITGSGRMAAAYARDCARLSRKALGRPPHPLEARIWMPLCRLAWHLADPRRALRVARARLDGLREGAPQ